MTVEFFSFDAQSEKNKIIISQILYKSFETKFKPILKKVSVEEGINIIKQSLSQTSGLLGREGSKILGVAILSSSENPTIFLDKSINKKIGRISYMFFKYIFYSEKITDKDTIRLELLAVNKDSRGKGVGSVMLSEIIKYARKNKIKKILLEVVDTNPRAKVLYKRMGFKTIKKYYSRILTKPFGYTGYDEMCLQLNKKYKKL